MTSEASALITDSVCKATLPLNSEVSGAAVLEEHGLVESTSGSADALSQPESKLEKNSGGRTEIAQNLAQGTQSSENSSDDNCKFDQEIYDVLFDAGYSAEEISLMGNSINLDKMSDSTCSNDSLHSDELLDEETDSDDKDENARENDSENSSNMIKNIWT